jgi:hypothetical protein
MTDLSTGRGTFHSWGTSYALLSRSQEILQSLAVLDAPRSKVEHEFRKGEGMRVSSPVSVGRRISHGNMQTGESKREIRDGDECITETAIFVKAGKNCPSRISRSSLFTKSSRRSPNQNGFMRESHSPVHITTQNV